MATTREGKQGDGSHQYKLAGAFVALRMGDGLWAIYERCCGELHDTGRDRKTLAECRRWARERTPAA